MHFFLKIVIKAFELCITFFIFSSSIISFNCVYASSSFSFIISENSIANTDFSFAINILSNSIFEYTEPSFVEYVKNALSFMFLKHFPISSSVFILSISISSSFSRTSSSDIILPAIDFISSLNNKSFNFLASNFSLLLISSRLISTGTSVIIVANFFENIACSLLFSKFSFSLFPLISSIFCKTVSILPYVFISLKAVFSPTPGTPGILSDLSPIRPLTSIN